MRTKAVCHNKDPPPVTRCVISGIQRSEVGRVPQVSLGLTGRNQGVAGQALIGGSGIFHASSGVGRIQFLVEWRSHFLVATGWPTSHWPLSGLCTWPLHLRALSPAYTWNLFCCISLTPAGEASRLLWALVIETHQDNLQI